MFVFLAWEQTMHGNADYSATDDADITYDCFKAPFCFDADSDVVAAALAYGYCAACVENYMDGYEDARAAILWEDNQGFVHCETYETWEAYDDTVREIEDSATEACGDGDNE